MDTGTRNKQMQPYLTGIDSVKIIHHDGNMGLLKWCIWWIYISWWKSVYDKVTIQSIIQINPSKLENKFHTNIPKCDHGYTGQI